MNLAGTIGTKAVIATVTPEGIEIKHNGAVLHRISELWMVGLQRVSQQLKTCDVVWLDGATQTPVVQSIVQSDVQTVLNHAPMGVMLLGMDPPPWPKLSATAKRHNWHKEDWLHVFSDDVDIDVENSKEEGSDGEWLPSDEEESDSDFDSDSDMSEDDD